MCKKLQLLGDTAIVDPDQIRLGGGLRSPSALISTCFCIGNGNFRSHFPMQGFATHSSGREWESKRRCRRPQLVCVLSRIEHQLPTFYIARQLLLLSVDLHIYRIVYDNRTLYTGLSSTKFTSVTSQRTTSRRHSITFAPSNRPTDRFTSYYSPSLLSTEQPSKSQQLSNCLGCREQVQLLCVCVLGLLLTGQAVGASFTPQHLGPTHSAGQRLQPIHCLQL